jgi:ferredoxin-NADP reductase
MAGTSPDSLTAEQLVVLQVRWEAAGVVSLVLARPDGSSLPSWEPGAHLDVTLPSGLIRQYSLCGDPDDKSSYTVAVLRESQGRGASVEVHDTALVGKSLTVRGPRNHFVLEDADRYVFVAGGIGITPILTMVREASYRGKEWTLVYGGRTRSSMAFVEALRSLDGDRVRILPEDEYGMLPLAEVLADLGPDDAVYACGPEGMLRAAADACAAYGYSSALHVERFGAGPGAAEPSTGPGGEQQAFEVELRRTGMTLQVPADRGLLEVVKEVLPEVSFSCEEGYCGYCETRVLEGTPDHRDQILSDDERENGGTMIICVGRSKSERLVLDL